MREEIQEPGSSDLVERYHPDPNARPAADSKEGLGRALTRVATQLGFVRVGFAEAQPFVEAGARFRAWLAKGHAGQMAYLSTLGERSDPSRLLPAVRSLIVVALAACRAAPPQPAARHPDVVARYAQGLDYHTALRGRLRRLAQSLANLAGRPILVRPCVDTAPLLEREAARLAGVGFIAKSTQLIAPGIGPRALLGVLLVDVELPASLPLPSRCGQCTACLDACPTKALVGPYQLDARRCISYLTIEHRGSVPRELRSKIGVRVFGCDICQQVCPFDRCTQSSDDLEPRSQLAAPDLRAWLHMTSTDYRRIARRTALRRADRAQLVRNAAVALGNSGVLEAVADLAVALRTAPWVVVRSHVAWALGTLGGTVAKQALTEALIGEPDAEVRSEIALALSHLDATVELPARRDEVQ